MPDHRVLLHITKYLFQYWYSAEVSHLTKNIRELMLEKRRWIAKSLRYNLNSSIRYEDIVHCRGRFPKRFECK